MVFHQLVGFVATGSFLSRMLYFVIGIIGWIYHRLFGFVASGSFPFRIAYLVFEISYRVFGMDQWFFTDWLDL